MAAKQVCVDCGESLVPGVRYCATCDSDKTHGPARRPERPVVPPPLPPPEPAPRAAPKCVHCGSPMRPETLYVRNTTAVVLLVVGLLPAPVCVGLVLIFIAMTTWSKFEHILRCTGCRAIVHT